MAVEDITTIKLNCAPQIQPPDQTSSRFIDRFIRLKTRYWNRGHLIVLLTFIGLTIQGLQNLSLLISVLESYEERNVARYIGYGMCIGNISGGVLATVFSAHKVFGISFIISSIFYFMEAMSDTEVYLPILSLFCIGMTLATATSASHRIYTFWVPLNKKSLRHVPIVLLEMITLIIQYYIPQINYKFNNAHDVLDIAIIVSIHWCMVWLTVVSGHRSQIRNSGTNVVSLRRVTVWDIPWKSFCTSMPVIALVLSYMYYANLDNLHLSYYSYQYYLQSDQSLSKHIIILLLLTFVLVELIPEITLYFSVTNVRKIFSCLYFVSMATIHYLEAFPNGIFWFLDINKFVYLFYYFMPYFCLFGFKINHLDIAPQYSSVLYGILMTIYFITGRFSSSILQNIWIFGELSKVQFCSLVAVISLAVAVFYAIFASADLQPWAVDTPVKVNQRDMQEEVNLTTV